MEIDTINDKLVCIVKDKVVVGVPLQPMDRIEAQRFAAWIILMANNIQPSQNDPSFDDVYQAVMNS